MLYVSRNYWVVGSQNSSSRRTGQLVFELVFYCNHIVMGYECWMHCYTLEMKRQSKEWLPVGPNPLKKFKHERSIKKVFVTVFWDAEGIPLLHFMLDNIMQKFEIAQDILWMLRQAIQNKLHGKLSKKILYLHDNARLWMARIMKTFLDDFRWVFLSYIFSRSGIVQFSSIAPYAWRVCTSDGNYR